MRKKSRKGIYIMLFSVHGLIRGKEPELGRDADTGGQILYVLELAKALGAHPDVDRVDLLTRLVDDQKVAEDYAVEHEKLSANVNLVRIPCGPRRYLRKEVLWPHLGSFIDGTLKHIRKVSRVPDIVHGHYADAGMVAARVAGLFGIPMLFTGHSLGKEKLRQLLKKGQSRERINRQYNIQQRIEAEEISLGTAELIIASTQQEVDNQYRAYDNYHPSRMQVMPPGVDISRFRPPQQGDKQPRIYHEIARFLQQAEKPMILALSRADERKNISTLVKAYASSEILRKKANLVIIAGNRDNITDMDKGARSVLTQLLLQIDEYDLYGKVAYPKHHDSADVPLLYRLAAQSKGVFVNPALTEPFGLTLIEAAASGLPLVATNDGGPNEIIANCENGLLVDPLSSREISEGLTTIINSRKSQWNKWSSRGYKGVHKYYSWTGHAESYMQAVSEVLNKSQYAIPQQKGTSRLVTANRIGFTSLDNALFGNSKDVERLLNMILQTGPEIAFGIATGRTLDSALSILKKYNMPLPHVLVTSVGTEIYYRRKDHKLAEDIAWKHQLDYRWEPVKVKKLLSKVPGIRKAAESQQRQFKISYIRSADRAPAAAEIKRILRQNDLHAKVIIADEKHMDVLPIRASKGLAIRYISLRWGIPLDRILVAGDSGNDEEMLLGDTLGIVVANHGKELDKLKDRYRVYFSEKKYAAGIIDGIQHYRFLGRIRIPDE